MRIAAADATIQINDNTMTDADNKYDATEADRGQIIKISGTHTLASAAGNTHNGNQIQFASGIATEIA